MDPGGNSPAGSHARRRNRRSRRSRALCGRASAGLLETSRSGAETGWKRLDRAIKDADPACRGVLTLGLNLPLGDLLTGLTQAAAQPLSAGFAIGRSIFGVPARDWFAGRDHDSDAVALNGYRFRVRPSMRTLLAAPAASISADRRRGCDTCQAPLHRPPSTIS